MIVVDIEDAQILFIFQTISHANSSGFCYSIAIEKEHVETNMGAKSCSYFSDHLVIDLIFTEVNSLNRLKPSQITRSSFLCMMPSQRASTIFKLSLFKRTLRFSSLSNDFRFESNAQTAASSWIMFDSKVKLVRSGWVVICFASLIVVAVSRTCSKISNSWFSENLIDAKTY